MKKVRLYESFHGIDEAKRGTIHKAVKAGDYPATIVVIENGKVIKQEIVNTPEAVPATFNILQKEYPKAKIHVEDRGGQTLFVEAYDGNMADFKYEFPQVFAEVTGNPEKAIKKIKKAGKGFEVRTSAYMSEEEMEEVASALGMVLVDYEKNSNMAISVFEAVVNEGLHPELKKAQKAIKRGKTVYGENIRFPGRFKIVELGNMYSTVDYEDGKGPMEMASMNIRIDSLQFESVVTEGKHDEMLDKVADAVKDASNFMNVGIALKKAGIKYDFSTGMMPMYRLQKYPIAIVNKKYVEDADREVGDIAIGILESVSSDEIDEKMVSAKRGQNYYKLYRDTPIKYISGKSGMGLKVPGVLLHNEYDTINGQEGAYIIDYFGAHFYVDMENKFALKIVDPKDSNQNKDLIKNMGRSALAPEHSDWKDFLNESESVNEGRSIRKIQNDYDKVVQNLLDTKESWKDCKASGDAKGEAKCLAELKELTLKKKALVSELDDAIGLKDVDAQLAESVNESIKFGSYYFPKTAQDIEKILPEGGWKIGETKYAVICHNEVQMGKNIMYLKSDNSKIGQNFEAHILSIHNTEEEAFEAYKNAVKYDEGMTASCVSYAYGTLKSKGANYPFDEIGGERRRIK